MQAGTSPARQARAQHRHELRTLTYVTLDEVNGGIVRNLSHSGVGVQAVAAVRPPKQVRVRFELRYPRLRVETMGEVMWSTFSGQCGIRFVDVPPKMARQIDEWILGSLLEGVSRHSERAGAMFPEARLDAERRGAADDGLMVSAAPVKVIELPVRAEPEAQARDDNAEMGAPAAMQLDWLSQPLSGRGLAWAVNTLVVLAALLLFALVFLSVTQGLPHWPVAMAAGAVVFVGALYWGFFKLFAGGSFGARLARLRDAGLREDEEARFR